MTVPHLRPMAPKIVEAICDDVARLPHVPYSIMAECNAFRESRTPWDGRRLANALANYDSVGELPEAREIVAELDKLALEKAGLVPGPRPYAESDKP